MYELKPMSRPEEDRLIEIEFYMFITYLLQRYNQSQIIWDILDTLSDLFGCNKTIIRNVTRGIRDKVSSIIPDKEELSVMLYKSGATVRSIRKRAKIHPQTLYRMLTKYKEAGQLELSSRLEEEVFLQVKEFMTQLDEIMRWK